MKKFFACIVCFSVSALIAAAGDATKLEGSWIGISGLVDGKKLPDAEVADAKLVVTFKEGKYSVSVRGKQLETGTYKIDPTQKPAGIDLLITEGKAQDKGKTQLGIFKVDADQLVIAIAAAGSKDRPKTFDGGKDIEVTTLKRKK